MPSFMPSDGRQGPDYRSNLHVPGMDSVPDTEVFECSEQTADKSFSTFGKETPLRHQHLHLHPHQNHHHLLKSPHLRHHQGSTKRKELETFLPSSRATYKPSFFKWVLCLKYLSSSADQIRWKRHMFLNWQTKKKHVFHLRSDSHTLQQSFECFTNSSLFLNIFIISL